MLDLLIVGAGLTSAVISFELKHKYKIMVVDVRSHMGGNCHDYLFEDTYIHSYGPHIFHTKNEKCKNFILNNIDIYPYIHRVEAEIDNGQRVPFPYSKETETIIGSKSSEEIIELFFKPYSKKMWGKSWEKLPNIIKNRIPQNNLQTSEFFPNQFVCLPKHGYSLLFDKLFNNVDIKLNCHEHFWTSIQAKKIIYCGRIDRILLPNKMISGQYFDNWLNYRNLNIEFKQEAKDSDYSVINYCREDLPYTRKTIYANFMKTNSNMVSYELPCAVNNSQLNPFYPLQDNTDLQNYDNLKNKILEYYPNIIFAGRIGGYKYIDMDQAILNGLEISQTLC